MSSIVLATDGSPSAQNATETAVRLAHASGWGLRVVAAWQVPLLPYDYLALDELYQVPELECKHATDAAAAAVASARAAGVDAVSEVREGEAVEEICAAVRESDADLLVVGAHGWGPLKRLVFGSVSTALLHHAPCPVLVVRQGEPAGAHAPAHAARSERS